MDLEGKTMKAAAVDHEVVSEAEWLKARKKLLVKEKKFTRMQDELSLERRSLPWVKVTKNYAFDGPKGKETLADLFEERSQLVIYHFMFAPDNEAGCPHCSLRADGFNGINRHLNHRDVTMIGVSRAPYKKLAFFNYALQDPGPSEREGHSVFFRDRRGGVFHTYSCYARGNDMLNVHYHYLDMVPKGRDENGRGPYWVRRHDEYEQQSVGGIVEKKTAK